MALSLGGFAVVTLLIVLAAKELGEKPLPPTGSEPIPAPIQPALPAWEQLTTKDVEEALEEGDATEDILRVLRSRMEDYAQEKSAPLPGPSSLPAVVTATLPAAAESAGEPTIRQVQLAAARYAEVMPQKIRRWRTLAQLRNFIPRFTLGLDRDRDTTVASSTSNGKTNFTVGPDDESTSLDFGFTWDLANLVWDPAQTSIDVRSRLMVQLRQDILEEATKLYFERRRLMAEFGSHPTEDPALQNERSLRLEELTAQLDALTGGLYSDTPPSALDREEKHRYKQRKGM